MKEFFKNLFEYNNYFNLKFAEYMIENKEQLSERAIELFSHIISAHNIWNSRIMQQNQMFRVWEKVELNTMPEIIQTNFNQSIEIINNYDFSTIISYKNTKGLEFNNNIGDILYHIINHSTYHRGQISVEFRKNNLEPIPSDYIFYKR